MNDRRTTFRAATDADAPALAELRVAAMRPSLEALGRFDAQRARDRFLSTFRAADTRVIERDGHLAGVLVLRTAGAEWLLDHLYIAPEHQGHGLGGHALQAVLREADAQCRPVRVGALKGSRSNEFYARHGFEEIEHAEWDVYHVRQPRGGPGQA